MPITAGEVFALAMTLMDEVSEDDTFDGYPDEYKKKAWDLISILQSELLPPNVIPNQITNLSDELQLDDRSCINVLPYGLASHLLISEDIEKAGFFNARYDELKRKQVASVIQITDIYNPWGGGV
ncbi:hypothetical protein [Fictibacillus sp. JL2B1089]|uniref:hypothetical protein n=1 Tax=Fictibacillus sp. JL2B1089 TaxID=3399565 RepID=UPI003A864A5D